MTGICDHCPALLEFDDDALGYVRNCPSCGMETVLLDVTPPEVSQPVPPIFPIRAKRLQSIPTKWKVVLSMMLLALFTIIVLAAITGGRELVGEVLGVVMGSLGYVALFGLALGLALYWLAFPYLVCSLLRQILARLPPPPPPE